MRFQNACQITSSISYDVIQDTDAQSMVDGSSMQHSPILHQSPLPVQCIVDPTARLSVAKEFPSFQSICFSQLSRNPSPCDIPLNTAWLIVILMLAYHHIYICI